MFVFYICLITNVLTKNMSKALEIWQDNVLTTARYEMTEAEKNLLYMVVASIRADDPEDKMYQVSVKDMAEIAGLQELKFEAYKQASRKLLTRVFETTLPNGNFLQTTFIASAEYQKGKGVIEIELSRKVRPFYVDLHSKFTKIQLRAAISLNSAYAKRVYELLCMYKNMPDKTFRRDLTDLKAMLGIIDPKTGKDSYPDWTSLQKRVLEVSLKEINAHTELSFSYKPIMGERFGRGRKPVVAVEFDVIYQAKPEAEPAPTSDLHERLVKQFRLRPDQATAVLASHSVETINRQLYDIQTKAADGKVKNLGAFTAKVFDVVTTKGKKNA